MDFYFCGRYINTDVDDKKVKQDMYATIPFFRGSSDHYEYENWELHLEDFFIYFSLMSEHKLCSNEAGWRSLLVVERQS